MDRDVWVGIGMLGWDRDVAVGIGILGLGMFKIFG